MSIKAPTSDSAFIKKRRRYVANLPIELLAEAQNDENAEADVRRESADRPREPLGDGL